MNQMDSILDMKRGKNATIIAHYYQTPEIQEVADMVGDSLQNGAICGSNRG